MKALLSNQEAGYYYYYYYCLCISPLPLLPKNMAGHFAAPLAAKLSMYQPVITGYVLLLDYLYMAYSTFFI
jgi:hypothetical protein